jgi:hypothetical protein
MDGTGARLGRVAKATSRETYLVGAQDRHEHEREAEHDRPGGDPVRARTNSLGSPQSRTMARVTSRRHGSLDEHQPLSGADLAYSAMDGVKRTHPIAAAGAALIDTPALDPLVHVLEIGPPGTGFGSSWHRRRC